MRFSIVLMLPLTYRYIVIGVKINIYMGRNLFTSGIRVGSFRERSANGRRLRNKEKAGEA